MVGVLYDATQPLSLVEMALPMPKPTLGQRNNNYGNLRTTDDFLGKTGRNKSYDTYETPEMGLRALARVLHTYDNKHGINTIDQLVNRYAPASDNPGGSHENYKKFLAQNLGIGVNDPLDVKGRRMDIMDAIIRFENKNRPLATRDQLQNAIYAADGTGDNKMAAGDKLSLADDYALGVQNGGVFIYPENLERYKLEMSARNAPALAQQTGDASGVLANIEKIKAAQATNDAALPDDMMGYFQDGAAAATNNTTTQPAAPVLSPELQAEVAQLQADGVPENQIAAYVDGKTATPEPILQKLMTPNDSSGVLTTAAQAADGPTINGAQAQNMPMFQASGLPAAPKMTPTAVSGNRRDQSPMSLMSPTIDTNEMLIRTGLAGIGGAQQGGLQALSDMGAMYGSIQDANRATGLEAYKAQLDAAKSSSADADTQAQLGQYDQALFDMRRAKEYLKDGGITGLFDNNIKGFFDKLSGNKRAVGRKLLEKLRVDDTLLRIAQTKGAISNKEMDLFLSPSPDLNDQESVWRQWIDDRIQAMERVRSRLSGGQTVDQSERASAAQVEQFGVGASDAPVSDSVAAARAALSQ